jgi:hypothetical protein
LAGTGHLQARLTFSPKQRKHLLGSNNSRNRKKSFRSHLHRGVCWSHSIARAEIDTATGNIYPIRAQATRSRNHHHAPKRSGSTCHLLTADTSLLTAQCRATHPHHPHRAIQSRSTCPCQAPTSGTSGRVARLLVGADRHAGKRLSYMWW